MTEFIFLCFKICRFYSVKNGKEFWKPSFDKQIRIESGLVSSGKRYRIFLKIWSQYHEPNWTYNILKLFQTIRNRNFEKTQIKK